MTEGRAAFAAFDLEVLARTGSTQDRVRRAARAGAEPGFCCVAHEQTAGRGRQGRVWTAPPNTALLMSILVRPAMALTLAPLAAGVAVCDAVAELGAQVTLRWPNDVVVAERKLAGVLTEVEPGTPWHPALIIGIGVNLAVPEFPVSVPGISLHELVRRPVRWDEMLAAIVRRLSVRLGEAAADVDTLRAAWRARATGLDEAITVTSAAGEMRGIARDIDRDGALLVETSTTGLVRVVAGDVHVLRDPH